MRKIITAVLASCLILGMAASCAKRTSSKPPSGITETINNKNNGTQNPVATGTDGSNSENSRDYDPYALETYDGWWKHIGSNVAGDPMVEVFHVDAEKGEWTEYSALGFKGGTYKCYTNEYGLNLEYGNIGTTILMYDGITLLNYSGYIEYIPGEPVEEVSADAYNGKWYELGDTDGAYYEISGTICTYYGDTVVTGTWTSENAVATTGSGKEITETVITAVCGDNTNKFNVADKGGALYDSENNTVYINSRDLGTIRGDDLIKKYDLICSDWAVEGKDGTKLVFEFLGNEFYLVNEADGTKDLRGTWSVHEYELSLHYSDGQEEITPYDTERLQLSCLDHLVALKTGK